MNIAKKKNLSRIISLYIEFTAFLEKRYFITEICLKE
jgi:hypothetical protein